MSLQPKELTPDGILQLGFAFWSSKTLLSAIELSLFTELAQAPLNADTLAKRLNLHPRSARDFLDALVALQMLERHDEHYRNTPETNQFLDRTKPSYIGGILELCNTRLYPIWGSLTEALQTGQPQNEIKQGKELFEILYSDLDRIRSFLSGMTGISMIPAQAIAQQFPWQDYQTFVDIGAAQGVLPVQIALRHEHLQGGGFDLPVVRPIYEEYVASFGLNQRLPFYTGDFFQDELPKADVLVMGHILHDWDLEQKRTLLARAYEA